MPRICGCRTEVGAVEHVQVVVPAVPTWCRLVDYYDGFLALGVSRISCGGSSFERSNGELTIAHDRACNIVTV